MSTPYRPPHQRGNNNVQTINNNNSTSPVQVVEWDKYVITPLRKYQARMCYAAFGKNSIVVLPTGSGKTLIATALASWHRERRGRTLFFVPTQMLVAQQANAVTSNSPSLRTAKYHGELAWPTNEYDVLVTTPEAFHIRMATGDPLADFARFTLVVFDEVHHVSKKHPYRKIARLLELAKVPKPTVLGLTATCTYAVNEKEIASDITKLCEALGITVILSASQEELVRDGYHGATPEVQLHTAPSPLPSPMEPGDVIDFFDSSSVNPEFMPHQSREAFFQSIKSRSADPIILRLFDLTTAVEAMAKNCFPAFESPMNTTGKKGKVSEWSSYAIKLKVRQAPMLVHLYEAIRLLVVTNSAGIDLVLEYLRMSISHSSLMAIGPLGSLLQKIIVDGGDVRHGKEGATTPYMNRFARLVNVIHNQLEAHGLDNFRGILFVQQRITTHILKNLLDRIPSLSTNLRTACIYATAGEATPLLKVTQTQSKERVGQFAKGAVNLLICTAVAEEGMDVPAANCIIRFDPVQTPVSFVQGRGRARQEESTFVVMDQREDRTVAHLTAAESAQRSLLEKGSVLNESQIAAATALREEGQKNRERNAIQFLQKSIQKNDPQNSVAIVKTYCKKSEREVAEVFKKNGTNWSATVSVMGINGEKLIEEVTESTKQLAKNTAYIKLLNRLVGGIQSM